MNRRTFLRAPALLGAAPALHAEAAKKAEEEDEVTPTEDLMQEHGVLKRVLLVYREGIARLDAGRDLPPESIAAGAKIIRDFVESYHEKNEEEYLFPRLRKAGKLTELVSVLLDQHQKGRLVTSKILSLATPAAFKDAGQKRQLRDSLYQFVRMYEPHEAREDTVLFPAFRKLLNKREFDALGELFEKREHQHFGEDGFEKVVDQVASIEKQLGIYDLAQFTPRVS